MKWLVVVAVVAACGSKESQSQGSGASGSTPGSGSGSALLEEHLPPPKFKVEEVGIPDDPAWKRAVKVVAQTWAESFNKLEVTTAKISPFASPDGATAPFLLRAEAVKGTETVFTGIALVSKNRMINSGGMKRLETHLASGGFPKSAKIPAGHLIEMLHVTNTLDRKWLPAPSVSGWALDKPEPVTLVYDDKGALLTVYREGTGVERIEIRFDENALITTTTSRKKGELWERFTE